MATSNRGLAQKLLKPDRKISYAHACGVKKRIRHGGVGADISELAYPLDAERVDLAVLFRKDDDLRRRYVGVHRDHVFGEIGVVEAGLAAVDFRRFMQGG